MGNTRELLTAQIESVSDDIREYVRQIESGEYGDTWYIYREVPHRSSGGTAYDELVEEFKAGPEDGDEVESRAAKVGGTSFEFIEQDEPTVNGTPISEYPLEVVDERGREFAVVISTGGPHIEVTADGDQRAYLVGYWGGEKVTSHGDHFDTFLDYFIER